MAQPDASAILTGWCGDTMEMYLMVEHEIVADITFMTDGCGATIACGSMLTSMVKGKPVDEVKAITEDDMIAALEGLPEENLHIVRSCYYYSALAGACNHAGSKG
jgi:nitrogen fixation NifU-like protein